MTTATITKVLKSKELNNTNYSLGFRRYDALPNRVRKSTSLFYMINHGAKECHSLMIANFEKMNDAEYLEFLKSN